MTETATAPAETESQTEPEEQVEATSEEQTESPPPPRKAEPFDVVRGVEKYILDTIERAEMDEHGVAGKIIAQRNRVARLNIAMLRMEQGKKQMKDRLENEIELLDSMEREADYEARMDQEQPPLPFGEKQPEKADDSWRAVDLNTLGLKEHVERKLIEGDVKTLGQLEDWRASHGENPKIKGLGAAARQDIDDAVERYWKEHPQQKAATEDDGRIQSGATDAQEDQPSNGDAAPAEKRKALPDAGPTVSEEWAKAQKPPMALAN